MDRYAPRDQRTLAARHEATWSAIASCTYLAPARIASDDSRERSLAEAAQARLLSSTRAARRLPVVLGVVTTAQRQEALMRRIVSMLPVGRRRDRTTTIDAAPELAIVPINQTVQL